MGKDFLFSTKREKTVLKLMVFISMLLPMHLLLKMNYNFAKYMARNSGHAFARNMVAMIEEREKDE